MYILSLIHIFGVKMPPQLMSLTIIFKQLIRFVKDSGIEPIEEVGREFEASYEDISLLNYVCLLYTSLFDKLHLLNPVLHKL